MPEQTWEELLRDVHDPNVPLEPRNIKEAAYSWAVMHYEESGPSCPAGAGIIRRYYHPLLLPAPGPCSPYGNPYTW